MSRKPPDDSPSLGGIDPDLSGQEPGLGIEETVLRIFATLRSDPDTAMRVRAAGLLAAQGIEAVPLILAEVGDPSEGIRWAVISSLGAIAPTDEAASAAMLPVLAAALSDERSVVRRAAADSLGAIGAVYPHLVAPVIPALAARLSDRTKPYPFLSHRRVCDATAEALERIATPEALAALEAGRSSS